MLDFHEGPPHSSHRVLLPLIAGPGWKQGWGRYSGHEKEQKPKVWGLGTGSGTHPYSCHLAIDWGWVESGLGCGGDGSTHTTPLPARGLLDPTERLDFFKERGENYDWTQSTVSGISPHPQHSCCSETISVSFQALAEGRLPGAVPVVTSPQGTRLPSRTRQDVWGGGEAPGGGRIVRTQRS